MRDYLPLLCPQNLGTKYGNLRKEPLALCSFHPMCWILNGIIKKVLDFEHLNNIRVE